MFVQEPASHEDLQQLAGRLGCAVPDDYVEFLRLSNGAEGFVGRDEYIALYSIEDIIKANVEEEFWREYVPGLLLFCSNGGGTAYAFDRRTPDMPVVDTPFIGGGLDYLTPQGNTLSEFIESLDDA